MTGIVPGPRPPLTNLKGQPLTAPELSVLERIRVANPVNLAIAETAAADAYDLAVDEVRDARGGKFLQSETSRERSIESALSRFREARDRLVEARQVRRINENRIGHGIRIENGVG